MKKTSFAFAMIFLTSSLWAQTASRDENFLSLIKMERIHGTTLLMSSTEVSQALYKSVMGENPSEWKGDELPVENLTFLDALSFCNKLSNFFSLQAVYSYNGTTDTSKWQYDSKNEYLPEHFKNKISQDNSVCGFRLPTKEEWLYAAKGGGTFEFSGSKNADEVAWFKKNSGKKPHEVATKKPNAYGLYDMNGNVSEFVADDDSVFGGNFSSDKKNCRIQSKSKELLNCTGFRFVIDEKFVENIVLNKNGKTPSASIPVSEEYTVKRESYDWYTSIDQIRTSTSDPVPASVSVTIALGYKKEDKAASTEITERRIEIIDFLRRFFSEQTVEDLRPQNEEVLRQQIRDQINDDILSNSRIRDVRFTGKDVIQQ
jgi:flagellar FliL protein